MTTSDVFQPTYPGTFFDPLAEVRAMARERQCGTPSKPRVFLSNHADKLTNDGRQRLVRR